MLAKKDLYSSKEKCLTDVENAFKASVFSNKVIFWLFILKKQLAKDTSAEELKIEDI